MNLNFHQKLNKLLCHYCGYKSTLHRACKDNKKCDLSFCGPGVERIFNELKKIYPDKIIKIFSSDTMGKNKLANTILKEVEKNKIDILVGTQLLSKGFHFPKLNCIVVVDCDFSSHGYDLRSSRKKYSIISSINWKSRKRRKYINNLFSNLYT